MKKLINKYFLEIILTLGIFVLGGITLVNAADIVGFDYNLQSYIFTDSNLVTVNSHAGSTITATDCTIPAGSNSCNTTVTWNTLNPSNESISVVKKDPDNTIVTTSNYSSITIANDYNKERYQGHEGIENFYLYNGEDILAQATSTATCTANSTHDGAVCACNIGTVQDSSGQCLKEVNLTVHKTINNQIINVPLLTKIARALGVFSKKDTIEAVPSSTKIQVDFIANGFNDNILCTYPDGSSEPRGRSYGTYYPTNPTTNTTYKITCTDTVDAPTPSSPTPGTPSISNIMFSNVLTNPPVGAYTPLPTISGTHYYHNGDDVNHVALEFDAVNADSCTLNNANPSSMPVNGIPPYFIKTGNQYYWNGNENMQIPPQVTIRCTNATSGLSSSLIYYFNVCSDVTIEDLCSLF